MSAESSRAVRKRSLPRGAKLVRRNSAAGHDSPTAVARASLELRALQGLRMIFGSARRFDADVRGSTRISGSLLWALSEIARTAGISVNALSERMALHQTTASNIVNALVQRKLIRRTRGAADQRVVQLHISVAGERVLQSAPGPHAGLLVAALRRLELGQLEGLQKNLAILVAEMGSMVTTAAGETLLGE
ncbi:MAG: MarR family transcriptional regulator [Steroidobacteraceae bacterium]